MKRLLLTTLFLLAFAATVQAQQPARRVIYGTSLPATCNPDRGDIYFKTGVSPREVYFCSATNTWTKFASGAASGDVTGPASSVDSEIALFSSTTGKVIKRASTTGLLKGTSGVLSAAVAGTDYYNPGGTDVAVADGGTGASTAANARTNLGAADSALMPAFARVTGSNATTSSTTLVDITGLSVPLAANSVYEFSASLTGNGADANGVRFGVNFSAAGASVEAGVIADIAGTGTRTRRISALNTATAQAFFTSATDVYALVQGVIVTGANPGNLTVQHLKVTSGTSTIYVNSYLRVTKIA